MKLSLSGVWKAYDMQTMNGQSPVLTRDSMMRSLRARVSPCFILMRFLSRHFMAYLGKSVRQPTGACSAQPGAALGPWVGGKGSPLLGKTRHHDKLTTQTEKGQEKVRAGWGLS